MKSKFASWLLCVLLLTTGGARTLTVIYAPGGEETRMLAISPDATNQAPVSNPTFTLRPGQTLTMPFPEDVRFWYWTPTTGWQFQYAEAPGPETRKDITVLLTDPVGTVQVYYTETNVSADDAVSLEARLVAGVLVAWFVVWCLRAGLRDGGAR